MNSAQLLSEAIAAYRAGNSSAAHALCSKVVASERKNIVALHLLGVLEAQQQNLTAALALFDRALKANPRNADILTDKGRVLSEEGQHSEALRCYKQAISINPKHQLALLNYGCTLLYLEHSKEALGIFDQLLEITPDYALALHNRAIALTDLRCYEEAIASSDRALKIDPNYVEALQSRGIAYEYSRRHGMASVDLKRALELKADLDYLRGNVYWSQLNCCDWESLAANKLQIEQGLRAGKRVVTPFAFLAISHSLQDQQICAEIFTSDKYPPVQPELSRGRKYQHARTRIAYMSADFRDHPVAYLLAGMFECHDRQRFEITGISYGPDDGSDMRRRLETSFEHFIDANAQNNDQIASLIKDHEIDILIDLTGYTAHSRSGILARKSAPVQVSYLGYSGTMGAKYIDYIIADRSLILDAERKFYTEKVVCLPDSFMGNDSRREISSAVARRSDQGLPEDGFVFCCFNNSYKILPQIFDIWMRLLGRIDHGVLWLSDMNETAKSNLRGEAQKRAVDPARLVFAARTPDNQDHLARLRLADLFLDTLPYNAHATASDALWVGLPVLTCVGASFAGRVAASLLNAIAMPELITKTTEDYEHLAYELATRPQKMAGIKQKLAANRLTTPLFDTGRFTKNIEAAYLVMVERHRAGLAPDHIVIA